MGQPTGSCYLLKSEYLRQFTTVALSKITKTDYTIKKTAGNCSQGKPAVKDMHLKECLQQNNDENRTKKKENAV